MEISIRKAEPKDFEEIYTLIKTFSAFLQTPEKVTIQPAQMLQDKDYFNCFIAVGHEKIVAFANWFFTYYSWTGKAVYWMTCTFWKSIVAWALEVNCWTK